MVFSKHLVVVGFILTCAALDLNAMKSSPRVPLCDQFNQELLMSGGDNPVVGGSEGLPVTLNFYHVGDAGYRFNSVGLLCGCEMATIPQLTAVEKYCRNSLKKNKIDELFLEQLSILNEGNSKKKYKVFLLDKNENKLFITIANGEFVVQSGLGREVALKFCKNKNQLHYSAVTICCGKEPATDEELAAIITALRGSDCLAEVNPLFCRQLLIMSGKFFKRHYSSSSNSPISKVRSDLVSDLDKEQSVEDTFGGYFEVGQCPLSFRNAGDIFQSFRKPIQKGCIVGGRVGGSALADDSIGSVTTGTTPFELVGNPSVNDTSKNYDLVIREDPSPFGPVTPLRYKYLHETPLNVQQFRVREQKGYECGFHAVYNLSCFISGNKWIEDDFKQKLQLCNDVHDGNHNNLDEDQVYELMCMFIQDEELQENVTVINEHSLQALAQSSGENRRNICDRLVEASRGSANLLQKIAWFNEGRAQYFLVTDGEHWLPFKFERVADGSVMVTTANSLCNIDVTAFCIIELICGFLLGH